MSISIQHWSETEINVNLHLPGSLQIIWPSSIAKWLSTRQSGSNSLVLPLEFLVWTRNLMSPFSVINSHLLTLTIKYLLKYWSSYISWIDEYLPQYRERDINLIFHFLFIAQDQCFCIFFPMTQPVQLPSLVPFFKSQAKFELQVKYYWYFKRKIKFTLVNPVGLGIPSKGPITQLGSLLKKMGSRGTGFPVSSQWSLQFNPTQATLLGDVIGEISNVNYFPFLQQSSWIWHWAWEDGSWHLKLCHWNSSQIWNPCLPVRIFFFKATLGYSSWKSWRRK